MGSSSAFSRPLQQGSRVKLIPATGYWAARSSETAALDRLVGKSRAQHASGNIHDRNDLSVGHPGGANHSQHTQRS